jgi:hypothetical protein
MSTQMPTTGETISAPVTYHVPFSTYGVSEVIIRDIRTYLYDLAHKLVPNHEWYSDRLLSPLIPFINVQIRATNTCAQNTN